jgi:dTDP-4-dehydrorhamnose reductase
MHTKKSVTKLPNRLPMSPIRKFCLLLILRPDLIKQEDADFFTSDTIDEKLALAIIEMTNNKGEYNSATIMHFLVSRFDIEVIKQIQEQLITFDEQMQMQEEINALRLSIRKRHSSLTNKSKLNEATKKSLDSLSEEEREFLKNIGKL